MLIIQIFYPVIFLLLFNVGWKLLSLDLTNQCILARGIWTIAKDVVRVRCDPCQLEEVDVDMVEVSLDDPLHLVQKNKILVFRVDTEETLEL